VLHLYEAHDAAPFAAPAGYARVPMCATTGMRPDVRCPVVVTEWLDAADRAYAARPAPAALTDPTYDTWLISQPQRRAIATRILFPRDGDRFVSDPTAQLQVEIAGGKTVDLTLDGNGVVPRSGAFVIPVSAGTHELVARSRSGTSVVRFTAGPHVSRGRTGFSVVADPVSNAREMQ